MPDAPRLINVKTYRAEFRRAALKQLESLPEESRLRILERLKLLRQGLQGDVKRLTNHSPEYRLRVGDYRVLFDIDDDLILIREVSHRKDAY